MNFRDQIHQVEELVKKGDSILEACQEIGITPYAFRSAYKRGDYAAIKQLGKDARKKKKIAYLMDRFQIVLNEVEQGTSITQSMQKAGLYSMEIYSIMTPEMRHDLNVARSIGILKKNDPVD